MHTSNKQLFLFYPPNGKEVDAKTRETVSESPCLKSGQRSSFLAIGLANIHIT